MDEQDISGVGKFRSHRGQSLGQRLVVASSYERLMGQRKVSRWPLYRRRLKKVLIDWEQAEIYRHGWGVEKVTEVLGR